MYTKKLHSFIRILLLIALALPGVLLAKPVHIDPGQWDNFWGCYSQGIWAWNRGPATVDWVEGETVVIRLNSVNFNFKVTESGIDVVSPGSANYTPAVGSDPDTITLNTVPVNLELNGYHGTISGAGFFRVENSEDGSNLTTYVVAGGTGRYGLTLQHPTGAGITFRVNASGEVYDINPPATATATANEISFNTAPLTIDPVAYGGYVRIWGLAPPEITGGIFTGEQTFIVPVGLTYGYELGPAEVQKFVFATDGSVTSLNPNSATGSQNKITFKNTQLVIDPDAYEGGWTTGYSVYSEGEYWQYGEKNYIMVPGATYQMRIQGSGRSFFQFDLDAQGNVSKVWGRNEYRAYDRESGAADGDGNILRFRNTAITIDPGDLSTGFVVNNLFPPGDVRGTLQRSPLFVNLIPDMDFEFVIGGSPGWKTLEVDSLGNVDASIPETGVGSPGKFVFNTVGLNIDPITLPEGGLWIMVTNEFQTDAQDMKLVPGIDYRIQVSGGYWQVFSLFDPCATQPSELIFKDTDENYKATIILTCDIAPPDTDEDGVPDEADNCPAIANADQIDLDGDDAGDACDTDDDNDDVSDDIDNCPTVPNSDQSDADNDYMGDICDDDDDGDSVSDSLDNCPNVANTDQTNNDQDGFGDACDADDDNDSIDDSIDNCRFTPNVDQYDYDEDGEGDACDGDSDGDNIVNNNDLCDNTPHGSLVNDEGCNGAQLISLSCLADEFANHGRYVRCVSHAAFDAVNQGLLTNTEKSRFVSQAAKGK